MPGVLPRFFLTAGVTLLALLPAGVAFLPTLGPLPLGVLADFLAELATDFAALPFPVAGPGELSLESGELSLLPGVEDLSLFLADLFLEDRGVASSSSSSSFGGRDFFLVLRVDILVLLGGCSWWLDQDI